MRHKLVLALVAVMLLTTGLVTNVASAQNGTTTTIKVTEEDVTRAPEGTMPGDNWMLYTRNGGVGTFREGPATPPLGIASLEFSTPTVNDKVWLFNYDYVGTALSSLTGISYSTYRSSDTLQQVVALNIEVDFNGPSVDGGFTTLIFEPVYNTNQGAVTSGSWQSWDAYSGGNATWWSSRDIPGVCRASCFVSWNTILSNNPNATILGGFGVNQGSGNTGLISASDRLTISVSGATTVYDFDVLTAGDMMDDLQADTAELVTNAAARRALLATLDRAEMYMDANRPLLAYLTMMQYVIQVERYEDSRRISGPVAQELISQALEVTRSIMAR